MTKEKIFLLIEGILYLVFGVLIACSIINFTELADIFIGISLLFIGIILIFDSYIKAGSFKAIILPTAIIGGIFIGVGITLFTDTLTIAGDILTIVKIAIICAGSIITIDGILKLVSKLLLSGLSELLIGAILILIGCLRMFNADFNTFMWVAIGIVIAIYGILEIISAFIALPHNKKEENNNNENVVSEQ